MLLVGVKLQLLGRAKVHWSVRRSKNQRRHYRAEEIYINEKVYVFGSCESLSALCIDHHYHHHQQQQQQQSSNVTED